MHFLVKWKGYPTSDNSWEPRENLHADRLITEYNKKKQGQAEPKKKGVKSRRARTEEIIPFSSQQHSPLHRNIMSARSAPISSGAMDATRSPSTPVTYTSMSPSTPREATSSSATPTTTPTSPVLRGSSKENLPSYRQFGLIHCGQCRLPKEYSHTLWARGIVSGWTCRCDKEPSPTTSTDLPLGQTARDAQRVGRDAGRLLAREDPIAGKILKKELSQVRQDTTTTKKKAKTQRKKIRWNGRTQ